MTTKGNWHQVLRILLWLSCSSNIWPNWIPSIFLFENSFPLSSVHLVYLVSDVDPYEMGEFVSSVRIPSQSDSWFSMIEGHLQFLSWVRHIHNVFQISMSRPKLLAYMQLRPRKILFNRVKDFWLVLGCQYIAILIFEPSFVSLTHLRRVWKFESRGFLATVRFELVSYTWNLNYHNQNSEDLRKFHQFHEPSGNMHLVSWLYQIHVFCETPHELATLCTKQ